jgi:hypothetical protein
MSRVLYSLRRCQEITNETRAYATDFFRPSRCQTAIRVIRVDSLHGPYLSLNYLFCQNILIMHDLVVQMAPVRDCWHWKRPRPCSRRLFICLSSSCNILFSSVHFLHAHRILHLIIARLASSATLPLHCCCTAFFMRLLLNQPPATHK